MYSRIEATDRQARLEASTRRLSRWVGMGLCAVACLVWVGWTLNIPFLVHLWSVEASMKPLTALGLFLGGAALAVGDGRVRPARALLRKLAAWAMLLFGAGCLVARMTGWASPGRDGSALVVLLMPAWATSAGLTLGALSLLTMESTVRWGVVTSRLCVLAVGLIAGVALMAYILGVADLYGAEPYRTMALHTAAGLFALSVGICLARPDRGVVALILRDDAGGTVARQLLPAVLLAPLAVGVLVETAIEAGVWERRMGLGIVVVLVVVGGMLAVETTARHLSVSDRQRRESERRIRMMLAELDHRVKNTMAAVLSMCEQTAMGCRTIDEFKRTYRGRLQAMARAHDALAATKWQGVSFGRMASTVVGAYSFIDGRALELSGEELILPSSAALPMAMTLNELATNAVKHGAWSNPAAGGRVRVTWSVKEDDLLEVVWEESGGPTPSALPDGGFGVSLIRGMIPHEMGGTVELGGGPAGVVCRIRLSLREARRKTEEKFSMAG